MVNNKQQSTFPKQYQGYKNKEIKCTNNATATWNEEEWSMEINNIENSNTICTAYFERYEEEILNGAYPVLAENLIPITINEENGKVTRADTQTDWYSYEDQKWANAVILEDDVTLPEIGQEIPEKDIESYFVWIPRYKYKIWDEGNYSSVTKNEEKVQTIEIEFESKAVKASTGNTINSWLTHPAFTAFDVNGLWVGKFESGYKDASDRYAAQINPSSEEEAISSISQLIIKPNEYSWRNIEIAKSYVISYNYQRNLDSHMIKNTEWGAVAYLQHSMYGSRASVRINNSGFVTGHAAIKEPTCGFTNLNEECNHFYGSRKNADDAYSYNYFNPLSVVASTTNNYTGIYDMSGGSHEYVMGVMETSLNSNVPIVGYNNENSSGFNGKNTDGSVVTNGIDFPDNTKYYDLYRYNANNIHYYNNKYGDATKELGPYQKIKHTETTEDGDIIEKERTISSWYNDQAFSISPNEPWVFRGGSYNYGYETGIFSFNRNYGTLATNRTFRVVLAI